MNDSIKTFMRRTILSGLGLVLFEAVLLFFFTENYIKYISGLLFGFLFNVLFFRLMYLNISKALNMQETKAKTYIFTNYMARYILSGFVLFIAAMYPQLSLYTCFLGLLTIKLVLHLKNFYNYISKKTTTN